MKRPLVAIAALVAFLIPILLMGAFVAIADEEPAPSDQARDEIPADLLGVYMSAARSCSGLDWTVLAAIHKVETGFGRGAAVSSKGAQGPMQFMPATWRAYGIDGDGDGIADVNDVDDAIFSASNLLCSNGAGDPARLESAIFNYNHSESYVSQVLVLAVIYGTATVALAGSYRPEGLLNNPRISLSAYAKADLRSGVVDPRLVWLLGWLSESHTLTIGVFRTGHGKYTKAGTFSNHFYGRAVDITAVDGRPVSAANQGAREIILAAVSLDQTVRPTELGHPFGFIPIPGGFSDADHSGHLHIGFD